MLELKLGFRESSHFMKSSNGLWRDELAGELPSGLAKEIDVFETEIALKKQGKIDDKVFAETRLRRGCYGQRYDNGRRHDGRATRELNYPSGSSQKARTRCGTPRACSVSRFRSAA